MADFLNCSMRSFHQYTWGLARYWRSLGIAAKHALSMVFLTHLSGPAFKKKSSFGGITAHDHSRAALNRSRLAFLKFHRGRISKNKPLAIQD